MKYRDLILVIGRDLLTDLGPETDQWFPVDAAWDPASPDPGALQDLDTAEVTVASVYDISPPALWETGAVVNVGFWSKATRDRVVVAVPVGFDPAQALTVFADQLQDHVMQSADLWSLPLPRCPNHPGQPLVAADQGGEVLWVCAKSEFRRPVLGSTVLSG